MRNHVPALVSMILLAVTAALPLYSQDAGRVNVDGGEIYYEVAGSGPAIVLIHGGFGDRRMWDNQFASFADSFRVVRYDLRGFGLSSIPAEPYSAVADLEALLDHLNIPRAHVVGNSMGASLALEFALLRPERTDHLVVVSNGANGYPYTPEDVESVVRVFRAAKQESLDRAVKLWLEHPMVKVAVKDPEAGPLLRQMVEENASLFNLEYWPGEQLEPSAYDRLDEIEMPVLFILGEEDTPLVQRASRASADRIPGAEWVVLSGADHLPQMESMEFDNVVLEFLRR